MLPYIPMTDHIADGAFGQCPFRSTNPNHYVNPNPKPLTPQTLTLSNHPDTLIIEALSMSLILKRRWGLVVTGGLRQGLRRSSNLGGSYSTAGGNDVNGGNGGTHSGRGNISVEKALDLSMSGTFSPRGSVSGMVVSRGSVSVLVGSRGSVSGVVSRCYAGKNDSGGGEDGGVGGSASFSEEKLGMTQQGKKGVAVASPGGKVSRLVRLESELNAELDAEPGLKDPKDIWKRMGMKIEGAEGGKGDGAAKIIDETPRRKGSVAERQTQEKPLESSRVKGIKTVLGFSNEYPPIELAPEDYDFTDFTDLTTRPPRMPIETDSKVVRCNGGMQAKSGFPGNCPIFNEWDLDFANVSLLRRFISASGMIKARWETGLCSRFNGLIEMCQRKVAKCIKRSRHMGMIPFVGPYRVDEAVATAVTRKARTTRLRKQARNDGSKFKSLDWSEAKALQVRVQKS